MTGVRAVGASDGPVSSANLTQSGAEKNLEAGLSVRGGHTAARVVQHVTQLQADGVLARLRTNPGGGPGG